LIGKTLIINGLTIVFIIDLHFPVRTGAKKQRRTAKTSETGLFTD